MNTTWLRIALPALISVMALNACDRRTFSPAPANLAEIKNVVVIYAENRSFDNLYGHFPGVNGLQNASNTQQLDRDGMPLITLPKIWGGLTPAGITPPITEAMTENLPNKPYALDAEDTFNTPLNVPTRDLWHRFYENQMQINGGKNNMFAAWADSGSLTMGHYRHNESKLPLWKIAQRYTLADNFFMGAFGGSYLNHHYLICACVPYYPDADKNPSARLISAVNPDGVSLKIASNSPASALNGPPKFVNSGNLTPDFYAVNTMQPPYQPSGNPPAKGGDSRYADPANATTLPPQTQSTIGDLLTDANISWAWYGGAWEQASQAALQGQTAQIIYGPNLSEPNFQPHHQPLNYYAKQAPGTASRAQHLLDGGINGTEFIKAIDTGTLPQVAFYKPQGNLNEHAGYTDVASGNRHIADLIAHLERSPQWNTMLVIVTYDENGGFWDHAAPPKGDRWGPGSRIPAIIVSPFAKRGFVDHTQYDTGSILRFLSRRFSLPPLTGIQERDQTLIANGFKPMGDLTHALNLSSD